MPGLSIIITNYNYNHYLPDLLENIKSQCLERYEVIIVDDCSQPSCLEAVTPYLNSVPLKVVVNEKRRFTKESRLIGVENSSGRFITFVDADDRFYGKTALRYHLAIAMERDVDILHFSASSLLDGKSLPRQEEPHAQPLLSPLQGKDIFTHFVNTDFAGHLIWGKIYKRDLWLRCLAPARIMDVRRYREDLFLSTLLFFHAGSYLGSERIGYQRERKASDDHKSFGRLATEFTMLRDLLPYLARKGAPAEVCTRFEANLHAYIEHDLVKLLFLERKQSQGGLCRPEVVKEMVEHADAETVPQILLSALCIAFGPSLEKKDQEEG